MCSFAVRLSYALFSDNTSCSGIAACQRSHILCATLSELISMRIPETKLRMTVIMSLSDEVPYFTGGIDSLTCLPTCCFVPHLLPAHHSLTEQLEVEKVIDKT